MTTDSREQSRSAEKTSPAALPPNPSRWPALLLLGLSLAVAVGARVRLLDMPLERDEGEYAYAGQLILEGIPPYQLAFNMKMPGTYLAYAAGMSVFGQTPAGVHLTLLAVHLAALAALFGIARKLLDLRGAAVATAACSLMTLSPAYLGLAAHATHFVLLPALLGIWMLLRLEESGRLSGFLGCGCWFGAAFLMKQPGMVFGLFGGLYLSWILPGWKITRGGALARLGLYALGCLLPFLAVCLWLKIAGVFPQFWFWTISYAREYAAIIPLDKGIKYARDTLAVILRAAPLLWIMAGLGLACLFLKRWAWDTRIFLGGFFIFSFLGVCPGFYFREHYFILLVPAVALFAGLAVSGMGQWLAKRNSAPWLCHLPLLLAAAACAQSLVADRAVLFSFPPRLACRAVYGNEPFPESLDVADYIQRHTRKDQRIAVIGSEPQIYFYARRHSSTSQIYAYPLMEPQPFARKMQEDMIRQIEQNPPEFLVFVSNATSWLRKPDSSLLVLDWVAGYVQKNMRQVGLIQFTGPQTTETVWGPAAAATPLRSTDFVSVFVRSGSGQM